MSSAWALIHHNNQILMIRRALDRGRGGQWCLPGGTIWRGEQPAVACVREAFEETGLRVTIEKPIAIFNDAHYFLCRMNSQRITMNLRRHECIDSSWIPPREILTLGTIMDLKRMLPIFEFAGLRGPCVPQNLKMAIPKHLFF